MGGVRFKLGHLVDLLADAPGLGLREGRELVTVISGEECSRQEH